MALSARSPREVAAVEAELACNLGFGAAEKYARRGWLILPCAPRGKPPLTDHGVRDATADPEVIRRWWDRWPSANIGGATGAESGFFVLDVDGGHGEDSLSALEKQRAPLPETVEARTGGGGRHLFFRHPGEAVRNSVRRLGAGLDVRGDGGYVILPPSLHPSGNPYSWQPGHSPEDRPIADAPPWLLERVKLEQGGAIGTMPPNLNPAYAEAVLAHKLAELARAPEGVRNDTLNAASFTLGKYIGVGALQRGLVERALLAQALAIGLPEREAQGTLASGLSAGIKECHVEITLNSNGGSVKGRDDQLAEGGDGAPRSPEFSDDALALRFSEEHASDLCYVATLGRWLFWDGIRWCGDDTLAVFDRARKICRAASAACGESGARNPRRIAQGATVAAGRAI